MSDGHDGLGEDSDVVVIGSGAAGLVAALVAARGGCSVAVVERAPLVGGTTAFSGGMCWVPGHPKPPIVGDPDDVAAAASYVRGLTRGRQRDDSLIDVYLETLPRAVELIESDTPLRLAASEVFTDYFCDRPGARRGGRSIEPLPFEAKALLGEWFSRLRMSPHFPIPLTADERARASGVDPRDIDGRSLTGDSIAELVSRRLADGIVANGVALAGGLLAGALAHGVRVVTGVRARRLTGPDVVTGVEAEATDGRTLRFGARRGVVLACGGFEWNAELTHTFLGLAEVRPASPPGNVGDGLLMGLARGASLVNMTAGWNYPVTQDPTVRFEGEPFASIASVRMDGGVIALNKRGRRFVNEACSYNDMAKAFRHYDEVTQDWPNAMAWLIFDQQVRDRASVNTMQPGLPQPDWVFSGATLSDLAGRIGLDPATVVAEVDAWNEGVSKGRDEAFGRGTVWFEGMTTGGPSPERLQRIEKGPFHAMAIYPGLIGTAGGLRTDDWGRVLGVSGTPIGGLYACGNTAASAFEHLYPAGGTTLGMAIAFGYRAGTHLSGQHDIADRPRAARATSTNRKEMGE
ncbi:FAD-dependent oxidoreductase [Nocardia rhamnosiphila]|uniref:FAD-dependent oxidoreductase n=1 Tax=Nocardia rhamnosiphila TaxID=426716 RepID=A0ABV2WYV4_9NOCA